MPPALQSLSLACALGAALISSACHTVRIHEDTRRGESRQVRRDEPPRPLAPRLELRDDGRLRLLEPLVCGRDTITETEIARVRRRTPNAATLVVGVIATAAGAVALVSGAASDDPAGSPLTYVGPVALAGGLPLAIGPLIGNTTSRDVVEVKEVRTPATDEPCGERPVAATRAAMSWSGLRVVSAVDGDGVLAVSPFAFVDAFAMVGDGVAGTGPVALTVDVERAGGPLRLDAVLEPRDLVRAAPGFLAAAGVDATVPPIRKVPRFEPGPLIVRRSGPAGARVVELRLPLRNAGPGDGFGVRLLVNSPEPELDARVVYVGRLPSGSERDIVASLPISDQVDRALAAGELLLAVRVRDAYDAAPETPVRWKGVARSAP